MREWRQYSGLPTMHFFSFTGHWCHLVQLELVMENNIALFTCESALGGTHIGKCYGDVPRSWPPFSGRSALSSLPIYRQCAAHVPPIFNFWKCFCILSLILVKILALNCSKFSFPRPPFFQENPLSRPYFWKPVWHTFTKKTEQNKVECPDRNQSSVMEVKQVT